MLAGGVAIFGVGTLLLAGAAATGLTADLGRMIASGVVAASGLAMYVSAALRLPSWARERQRQMEEVAARLALTQPEAPPD